jgi:hypothetical protein
MVAAWLLAVGLGLAWLWRYKSTPAEAAAAPPTWPAGSELARDPDRPTLILFAHPQCPCSRASVHELARLLADVNGRLAATVVFVKPAGTPAGWEDGDLLDEARRVPGVRVALDEGGREATRFGAVASGQVVVYGGDGRLAFAGGITIARGHEGDNPGRARITDLVNHGHAELARSPVFGCALLDGEVAMAEVSR